jgi:hypothetical protein
MYVATNMRRTNFDYGVAGKGKKAERGSFSQTELNRYQRGGNMCLGICVEDIQGGSK